MAPNPSIDRTHTIRLRLLVCAAHV